MRKCKLFIWGKKLWIPSLFFADPQSSLAEVGTGFVLNGSYSLLLDKLIDHNFQVSEVEREEVCVMF